MDPEQNQGAGGVVQQPGSETPTAVATGSTPAQPNATTEPARPKGVLIPEEVLLQMGIPPEALNDPVFQQKYAPGLLHKGLQAAREERARQEKEQKQVEAESLADADERLIDELTLAAQKRYPNDAAAANRYFLARFKQATAAAVKEEATAAAKAEVMEDIGKRSAQQAEAQKEFSDFFKDPANEDFKDPAVRDILIETLAEGGYRSIAAAAKVVRKAMKVRGSNVVDFRRGSGGDGSAFYEGVGGNPNSGGERGGMIPEATIKRVDAALKKTTKELTAAELDAAWGW